MKLPCANIDPNFEIETEVITMPMDTRELFARLIQCEAGGEGTDGMQAVATVIMNRATIDYGEFSRVSQGGDVRSIITQPGQFVCNFPQICSALNGR